MKQEALFSVVKNIMIEMSDPKEGINTNTDDYYRRKLKNLPVSIFNRDFVARYLN